MRTGKHTKETALSILARFREPADLPAALASVWIKARPSDTPSLTWSPRNQAIMVLVGGTDDARGLKQWNAANRHVKKGAKAFYILAPCVKTTTDDSTGEESRRVYGFRDVPVFRIEDTEGKPIDHAPRDRELFLNSLPLIDVARHWGIKVNAHGKHQGRGAQGRFVCGAGANRIDMFVENPSTFTHELIHAADHKLGNLKEPGQHWRAETVAEFGGAVLLSALGMETAADLGGAYRYITAYAKDANKTAEMAALECLDRICKAVQLILDTAEKLDAPAD